jgi:HPt (histidine-containing phosphotransfer) domain-containing protein
MQTREINTTQITDLTYLASLCGDDPEFKKEMIETFLKNTPALINEMKDCLKVSEWKKIGDIAHKMKPSFTFMGIHAAKDLILILEKNGRNEKDTTEIKDLITQLDHICSKALVELENDLSSI